MAKRLELDEQVGIRMAKATRELVQAAARLDGMTEAEWGRRELDRAAQRRIEAFVSSPATRSDL